jgi:hypothetical protein
VPKGGVDAALLEEWKATGTGLYRKDNNEFPQGLFDPKWKLRLQTVADRLQGYFDHPEPKSNGRVGELKRKIVVSLDKHYIGKETSPLDDDNELLRDDEPITTSSDLVLRSVDRNLQPLIDAGIPFRQGKRLTFAEMHKLKKDVVLHADGTLTARRLTCKEYLAIDVPGWAIRNKAWKNLQRVGRFAEMAAKTGMPVTDIDYAARFGDQCDFRCDEFDWAAILKATEDVLGIAARRERVKAAKRKKANWTLSWKGRQNVSMLFNEMQARKTRQGPGQPVLTRLDGSLVDEVFGRFLFPTEILNYPDLSELGSEENFDDDLSTIDIVSPDYLPLEVDYWSPAARKGRAKAATAARVTKHRSKKSSIP